jgi:hypothetical protein
MFARLVLSSSVLLVVVLAPACGQQSPSAPSSRTSSNVSAAPPNALRNAPSPSEDFTALVGVWNVTLRLTKVDAGGGCVADTMRSQIGEPKPYTLLITEKNSTPSVTLKSGTGDRACTFTPVADNTGFTTYGAGGIYTCDVWSVALSCSDGTQHKIITFGEDISGQLSSSNEMTGSWDAYWLDTPGVGFGTTAQFTATR